MVSPAIRFALMAVPLLVCLPLYVSYAVWGMLGVWSAILGLITCVYLYGDAPRRFLSNHRGPPSRWLIGHLPEMGREGYHEFYGRVVKEYGKVSGVCMGTKPQVVIADPDLIRQVGLEKFDSFRDRPEIFTMRKSKGLLTSKGAHWQSSRRALNPAFNTIKLNAFAGIINRHCATLVRRLDRFVAAQEEQGHDRSSSTDEPIDMLKLFQDLTMDVIGSTSFDAEFRLQEQDLNFLKKGKDREDETPNKATATSTATATTNSNPQDSSADNPHTKLLEAAQYIFGDAAGPMGGGGAIQIFIAVVVPCLWWVYKAAYPLLQTDHTRKLWKSVKVLDTTMADIVNQKHQQQGKDDDEGTGSNRGSFKSAPEANFIDLIRKARHPETGIGLEDDEVRDQLNLFVLAGYETTANALTYTSYLLAQHPKVERKLVEEIDRLAPKSGQELSFKDLAEFTYLQWVISEALRLYPPGAMLSRYAEKDVVLRKKGNSKDGAPDEEYFIKKGTSVVIPVYSIHRDEDYWENPFEFDPERFSPKRSEGRSKWAHLPFGIGPRNCIGQRFALEEAKLALISLYREYTLKLHPQTELPLKLRAGITLSPAKGVYLTAHRRQRS